MNFLKLFVLLLSLAATGCGSKGAPPAAGAASQEFEKLLQTSVQESQAKTEAHKAWGLGTFDRWDMDQETGLLIFSNPDGSQVTTTAQIIGTFSTRDNSWLWSWDNPSILDPLKTDALKVKAYGEQHKIERLTTRKWIGTEEEAWAMAALAAKLNGSDGVYRGPSGISYTFFTFKDIKISKANATP